MKRILIVRTDRIGDVVMVTPMVRELRKRYPDAFIATLTQPYTKDIFLHNPHVNVCLTDDLRKETFWNVVHELRSYKFSDGLLVLPTERATYQMFLAGIWNRVSVGHRLYAILTFMKGISRNNYIPLRHEADYCMDLARSIGVVTDRIAPEIFVSEDEQKQARMQLLDMGMSSGDTAIYVHTGTRGSSPNWSEGKYIPLIRKLLEEFDDPSVKLVLTAREMSPEFLQQVKSLDAHRIIDISSMIVSVRDFIKMLSVADLLISPSTGPAHIADALNIQSVVIHCHRRMSCIKYWGILNQRSVNLEVSDTDCMRFCSADQQICGIDEGIGVDEVVESAKQLLVPQMEIKQSKA